MRVYKKAVLAAGAAIVAAQFVPLTHSNPPVESDVSAPADVRAVLDRACYDCHSNETVWPWYSYVAPVSWLVAHDVNEGREHVNFSTWGRLDVSKRADVLRKIRDEVGEGHMPPRIYFPMHPEARLTDADKAAIEAWTSGR
jgi:hypothetical protein